MLFLQFKGLIEDSEQEADAPSNTGAELRKRKGSLGTKDELAIAEAKKKDVLEGLQELLNGYKVSTA